MGPREHVVEKEMAVTHRDFLRLLPKAVGDSDIQVDGGRIRVGSGRRLLRIDLSEESVRQIANLKIPLTRVKLTFSGYGEDDIAAALEQFWRAFQKGGG